MECRQRKNLAPWLREQRLLRARISGAHPKVPGKHGPQSRFCAGCRYLERGIQAANQIGVNLMSKYASKAFWVDAGDRVIASFAQGAIGSLALDSVGLLDIDWEQGLSFAGAMALLSLLTSVAVRDRKSTRLNSSHVAIS